MGVQEEDHGCLMESMGVRQGDYGCSTLGSTLLGYIPTDDELYKTVGEEKLSRRGPEDSMDQTIELLNLKMAIKNLSHYGVSMMEKSHSTVISGVRVTG